MSLLEEKDMGMVKSALHLLILYLRLPHHPLFHSKKNQPQLPRSVHYTFQENAHLAYLVEQGGLVKTLILRGACPT